MHNTNKKLFSFFLLLFGFTLFVFNLFFILDFSFFSKIYLNQKSDTYSYLVNGNRIKVVFIPSDLLIHHIECFPEIQCKNSDCDLFEREKINTVEGKFTYISPELKTNINNYKVSCILCKDESCKINNGVVTSDSYFIDIPKGFFDIDTSDINCNKNKASLSLKELNKEYLHFNVQENKETILDTYIGTSSTCLLRNDCFSFNFDKNKIYDLYLYSCQEDCEKTCNDNPDCLCKRSCKVQLDFLSFSPTKCIQDFSLSDIKISENIPTETEINGSLFLFNKFPISNDNLSIEISIYKSPVCDSCLPIEIQKSQIFDLNYPNSFQKIEFSFNSQPPGEYRILAEIHTNIKEETIDNNILIKDILVQSISCSPCENNFINDNDCNCMPCILDSHCSDSFFCENNKCTCDLECPEFMIPTNHCSKCSCNDICNNEQIQLLDCSCVEKNKVNDSISIPTKLKITSPNHKAEYFINDKIILSYQINENYLLDVKTLFWVVNGNKVKGENGIIFIPNDKGAVTIDLLLNEKVIDTQTIDIRSHTNDIQPQIKQNNNPYLSIYFSAILGFFVLSFSGIFLLLRTVRGRTIPTKISKIKP